MKVDDEKRARSVNAGDLVVVMGKRRLEMSDGPGSPMAPIWS